MVVVVVAVIVAFVVAVVGDIKWVAVIVVVVMGIVQGVDTGGEVMDSTAADVAGAGDDGDNEGGDDGSSAFPATSAVLGDVAGGDRDVADERHSQRITWCGLSQSPLNSPDVALSLALASATSPCTVTVSAPVAGELVIIAETLAVDRDSLVFLKSDSRPWLWCIIVP